jgi:nucleoside-diphosphate-sugar epimerase
VFVGDVSGIVERTLQHRSAGLLNVATGTSRSFFDVATIVAGMVPGAGIDSKPRGGPISHRRFDVSAVAAAFPDFRFTALEDGLSRA